MRFELGFADSVVSLVVLGEVEFIALGFALV
jgi:hypothetical protein